MSIVSAILAAALLIVTSLGLLSFHEYWIDTLAQLRLAYIIASLALLFLCALTRSKAGTIFGATSLFVNLCLCGSLYFPPAQPAMADPQSRLKLIAANIYGACNHNVDAFIELVRNEQPDVLAISEMTPMWSKTLKKRLPDYPVQLEEPYPSGGAAIFSRVPMTLVQTQPGIRRFGVRGLIDIKGQPVLLIASHPPAPSNEQRWKNRNIEFSRLADDIRATTIPVIVTGDLNCTPWSAYFQRLMHSANLIDSEQGFGPQPSWSVHHPIPLVPIDHCLFSRRLIALDRHLGPKNGSDHLPLVVTLSMR